jgi:hypothetical protein
VPAQIGSTSVFLNCPFDPSCKNIFTAIVFCVLDAGFIPRCALERDDSTEIRVNKVCEIIAQCQYGIHDISYVQLDPGTGLPRFNMPLELGIFLGCKRFGGEEHSGKRSLILDAEQYRYQRFISDIAGQDIHSHDAMPEQAIHRVRDWLRTESGQNIPGGVEIGTRYARFQEDLPRICEQFKLPPDGLAYADFVYCAKYWLELYPSR